MILPLETHYEAVTGDTLPLPPALESLYGALRFPAAPGRSWVLANFVTTLDGVVSWNVPGMAGGGEISGNSAEDSAVMGLLRAASDAVVIGAATLKVVPDHLWTPEHIQPALADAYYQLRENLGKPRPPLAVIVTGSGSVDPRLRVFVSGEEPALILTSPAGEQRLRARGLPAAAALVALPADSSGSLRAADMVRAVAEHLGASAPRVLVEGGPRLMADLFREQVLDDLFLTLSPQVAGRDPAQGEAGWRPGLVEGALLAPAAPAWGRLVSLRQRAGHLFLRYQFPRSAA
jgi:riboflavin biosynthesis pyrimidine reductase